jgi:hypothetical protein
VWFSFVMHPETQCLNIVWLTNPYKIISSAVHPLPAATQCTGSLGSATAELPERCSRLRSCPVPGAASQQQGIISAQIRRILQGEIWPQASADSQGGIASSGGRCKLVEAGNGGSSSAGHVTRAGAGRWMQQRRSANRRSPPPRLWGGHSHRTYTHRHNACSTAQHAWPGG